LYKEARVYQKFDTAVDATEGANAMYASENSYDGKTNSQQFVKTGITRPLELDKPRSGHYF